ncbi:ribosome-binding factor A [Arachidicoccus rhizosphaerae]|jgi:ribosome-binding factor A|uniref:Ribosome-binding factor A n=1 Tax=Arachidicoccus rhizosphaerae TaxID=551991 RepID=A0A1H3XH52_9BACT|nr:ribosome-binding factor A [Arachidicoccus rhizosphaerae]SDZ98676.1 ribosome-binding factor A [Arachidicoccus rhizosphaerae]
MQEGKRQKQVASVIKEEMSAIFRHLDLSMTHGGMVSIADVKVTPDLLEARIYLSFFQVADTQAAILRIEQKAWEIKKLLSQALGKTLRRIPVIHYFLDDTLDHVFHIEELLAKINQNSDKDND